MDIHNSLDTLPLSYRKLRIHLTASQKLGNAPTLLRVVLICVHDSGVEEEVLSTKISFLSVSKLSAVFRYFSLRFVRMVKNIPHPKEGFDVYMHDLGAFLVFARIALPHTDTFRRKYFSLFNGIEVEFHLGDAEFALDWWDWVYNGGYQDMRKSSLTLEQMGITGRKHYEKQKGIRERLALWQMAS